MNKLSYNIQYQRITADNYWLGGGMANNLVNPISGTLDAIEGDVNLIAQDLMDNLMAYNCTEKVEIEIEPIFPNMDELMQQDNDEGELYFYHGDHLGSSSWITDGSGNVNQHLAYMPFGESFIDQRSGNDIRFKFTGKERDSETGFDYFGARYYASDISVWLSVDPLSDEYPSMSPFMYTAGNPVMLVDPDGTWVPGVDKNGNITLTAEKGDNAKSLTSYFNRKMRSRYLGTFPMSIKTGTVVTLKNDNTASKAYKHSTENSDLYTDGNSWWDRKIGYRFMEMNYNCFEFAINVVSNTNINYKSSLRTDPNTFGFFLNTNFSKQNGQSFDNSTAGESIIAFYKMDGKNKVYTHGAVYMGKSKDETEYFMTKNGAFRKPEIMTLEGLKKEYGDKYEVWNRNNE